MRKKLQNSFKKRVMLTYTSQVNKTRISSLKVLNNTKQMRMNHVGIINEMMKTKKNRYQDMWPGKLFEKVNIYEPGEQISIITPKAK